MGFIGSGNYDAVSSILPASVVADTNVDNSTYLMDGVLSGEFVAGYWSEGGTPNATLFEVFETGIVSPRAILYRLDSDKCVEIVTQTNTTTTTITRTEDGDSDELIVALIVLAVLALILALLLAFVIIRERAQKPLFMPLITTVSQPDRGHGGVETGKV